MTQFSKLEWDEWGLSTPNRDLRCPEHDLVAAYLEGHPEIAREYLREHHQIGGKMQYYNVLRLAEAELVRVNCKFREPKCE